MEDLIYQTVKTQEQYEKYAEKLYKLLMKDEIDVSTQEHINLLLLLIKDWDSKTYDGKDYDPVEIIKSLIDDHDLNQKDLAKIVNKSESYISEILNYKKYPSKNVIRAISNHFKISQEALNKPYRLDIKKRKNSVLFIGYIKNNTFVKEPSYSKFETVNPKHSGVALYKLKTTQFH